MKKAKPFLLGKVARRRLLEKRQQSWFASHVKDNLIFLSSFTHAPDVNPQSREYKMAAENTAFEMALIQMIDPKEKYPK